ncbi:hypothetical protein [Streptomyces bobili]|uniref:DNA polymerase Y-family little finger domain-containing protein n=1 Tax=Streptomyces bobili TaxID=67280 RepID=A0ABZ1QPX8_9ACTN|nr:hypothetical protein [Streptomyces bobili]
MGLVEAGVQLGLHRADVGVAVLESGRELLVEGVPSARRLGEDEACRVQHDAGTEHLKEASGHDDDLRVLAYQLMDAARLQRGRLTAITLKGEDLVSADQVARQISLDDAREARLVTEATADRIRDKFGAGVIGPAAVFRRAF